MADAEQRVDKDLLLEDDRLPQMLGDKAQCRR